MPKVCIHKYHDQTCWEGQKKYANERSNYRRAIKMLCVFNFFKFWQILVVDLNFSTHHVSLLDHAVVFELKHSNTESLKNNSNYTYLLFNVEDCCVFLTSFHSLPNEKGAYQICCLERWQFNLTQSWPWLISISTIVTCDERQ